MSYTVKGLLNELKNEHNESYEHSIRCGNALATWAKERGMKEIDVQKYREAGYLHDVGKLHCLSFVKSKINLREVMDKANSTKNEKVVNVALAFVDNFKFNLNLHTTYGEMIVKALKTDNEYALDAVNYHHARYKNTMSDKYNDYCAESLIPRERENVLSIVPKEQNIPEIAQMLCIIDTYDAMKYKRIYQSEIMSDNEVEKVLDSNLVKGQYNPVLYKEFKEKILPQLKTESYEQKIKETIMSDKQKNILNNISNTTNKIGFSTNKLTPCTIK